MSDDVPCFDTLDRGREIEITQRNLPHWFQPGAAIFVTFRTMDSLPIDVVRRMHHELKHWLNARKLPIELADSSVLQQRADHEALLSSLSQKDRVDFRRHVNRLFHWSLDECHGSCLLKRPELAQIVAQAIQHDDGVKFDLERFVIMPNHAHVMVQFRTGFNLSIVGQSWMRYSARQVNKILGKKGAFWQPEPFDHIIRSPEQFGWLQHYITDNPRKANLQPEECLLWTRGLSN